MELPQESHHEQKLELEIVGTVFTRGDLYGEVRLTVTNIGNTKHHVQHDGTFCEISVVHIDLSEQLVQTFEVFTGEQSLEPDESMIDCLCWGISESTDSIVWVKLTLRVVSNGVQWSRAELVRTLVST